MSGYTGSNNSTIPAALQPGWQLPTGGQTAVAVVVLSSMVMIATRLLSAQSKSAISPDGRPALVPVVPYWIPFLGHAGSMAWDATAFVTGLRDRFGTTGIFALNLGGTTHNVIYKPSLASALLGQKHTHADSEDVGRTITCNVFGYPKTELQLYDEGIAELVTCYKMMLSEPFLGDMVRRTATKARENLVNLVTYSRSPVDQGLWERSSGAVLAKDTSGTQVVEASLLPLIRDFCANMASESIIGSNFGQNFPDFFDHLWILDRGFLFLATGLPRWTPVPSLTRAHIARRKLLQQMMIFHEAMEKVAVGEDPGSDWRELDDVSPLVKARTELYRKYKWSMRARAATEVALLWATNANSNTLIFWMINRIYSDTQLLARVREEIDPYIKARQPKKQLQFAESPRFENFDVEGLCSECPLLKSCYVECLRLDTASWSLKMIKQDFVLQTRDNDGQAWLLKNGDYAHVAHDLHNTDPTYFEDPMEWRPERHMKPVEESDGETKVNVDLGSIRPYGGGSSMCKGRAFAFKECMLFAAGIIALWDIEPAGGGPWRMPKHKKATGVYSTSDDTRVWIKQRRLQECDS